MYSITTIIVTYKRQKELEDCIYAILNQTILPKELIIIDNGKLEFVKNLCKKIKLDKRAQKINIIYVESDENSLTVGKNKGIQLAKGNLISIIDDDMIIEKDYYKFILEVFDKNSDALGVMGFNTIKRKNALLNKITKIYNRIFLISANTNDYCNLWPSLGNTYPLNIKNKIIPCMWLSGQSTFKKSILLKIKPDNNLKKYCWNEDIDLSHRIYKKYPNTLFLTGKARYFHEGTTNVRMPKKDLIYMEAVYDIYLFNIHFGGYFENTLIFIWSKFGRILKNFIIYLFNFNLKNIWYLFCAQFYVLINLKKIKNKDISFFNNTLR
ncbi:MAG TPA: glycosyltransferase [archaeon]|nr:glycosyltransferase [archaeon]